MSSSSSSYKGLARKRSREDEGASQIPEMPRNCRIPEMPPRASKKLLESKAKAEKGVEARKSDEGEKRVSLDSPPALESPPEFQVAWWDFPAEWPWYSAVDEQLCLSWFPCAEDDLMGVCAQNEEIWEDDLWQIKDIHQIPNQ